MSELSETGVGTPQTNTPEISVSELANALKRTIEDRFGRVRVRGEISNYRGPHASGHAYFCLKDQNARLDAVIWKSAFSRLRTRPQEGLEVIATGRITTRPHGAVGDAADRWLWMAASQLGRLGPRMPLIHGIRSASAWPRKPPRHRARRGGEWRI